MSGFKALGSSWAAREPVPASGARPVTEWVPVSRIQARMFELHQKRPQADIVSRAGRLKGKLDLEQLRQALQWTYGRYPILNSSYAERDCRIMRRSLPDGVPVTYRDCEQLSLQAHKTMMRAETTQAFDLARGPLFRTLVYRLAPGEHLVVLQCHHIVADGGTILLWIRGLLESYAALESTGEPPPMSVVDDYAQYTAFEQEYLQTKKGTKAAEYWQSRLREDARENMPQDDLGRSLCSGIRTHTLSGSSYRRCVDTCKSFGTSMVALCAAAFQQSMTELCPVQPHLSATLSLRMDKRYRSVVGPMFVPGLLSAGEPHEPLECRRRRLSREIMSDQLRAYAADTIGPHGTLGKTLPLEQTALFAFFTSSPTAGHHAFAFGETGGLVELGQHLTLESYELPWRLTPYGLFLSVADCKTHLCLKLIHNLGAYDSDAAEKILRRVVALLM